MGKLGRLIVRQADSADQKHQKHRKPNAAEEARHQGPRENLSQRPGPDMHRTELRFAFVRFAHW